MIDLCSLTNKTLEFRDKQLHTYLGDINFFLEKRAMENIVSDHDSESSKQQGDAKASVADKMIDSLMLVEFVQTRADQEPAKLARAYQ